MDLAGRYERALTGSETSQRIALPQIHLALQNQDRVVGVVVNVLRESRPPVWIPSSSASFSSHPCRDATIRREVTSPIWNGLPSENRITRTVCARAGAQMQSASATSVQLIDETVMTFES